MLSAAPARSPGTCSSFSSSLVASGWFRRLASSSCKLSSFCPRRRARWISTLCAFTRSKTYLRSFSRATWVREGARAWVREGAPRGPKKAASQGHAAAPRGAGGGNALRLPADLITFTVGGPRGLGLKGARDPFCLVTSIELRRCASLIDTSFPQALEMVH